MVAAPLLLAKTPPPTIGGLELNSIAAGIETLDALVKEAPVEPLLAEASSAGKYLILLGGEVDEVARSLGRAVEAAGETLIDDVLLPSIHNEVGSALTREGTLTRSGGTSRLDNEADPPAVGVIECYGAPTLLGAADCAAKTGAITIESIHLLAGIGGKATCVVSGDVESARVAVDAAASFASDRGLLARRVLIPRPDASILPFVRR
ncbi:MAG: BMC domain-containing protein [Planctomycetota bacterium]